MSRFFTSPKDLMRWVKEAGSASEAADKIINIIESPEHQQDILETTQRIHSNNNVDNAASVLFGILSAYNITETDVEDVEHKFDKAAAADVLFDSKVITSEERDSMKKEAQIMRQPGQYNMPLRVCPKLPKSVGKGIISTYNCRHYCLDGIVFDDDPDRVYCYETMWRRHVMDKFSREWKDKDSGEWVGGYINDRFHTFPDAGTPAQKKPIPKDHGNTMALAPWERTRKPREHQYSVERRLQEQRDPGSTESIALYAVNREDMVKISSRDDINNTSYGDEDEVFAIFSGAIEYHNKGYSVSDAALKLSEKHGLDIGKVVKIQEQALRKMASNVSNVYRADSRMKKLAQAVQAPAVTWMQNPNDIKVVTDQGETFMPVGTVFEPKGEGLFEVVVPGQGPTGSVVKIDQYQQNGLQPFEEVQQAAAEVGLTEDVSQPVQDQGQIDNPVADAPVVEAPAAEQPVQ